MRRATPLSNYYGFDRGTPIDRYYIERFLRQYGNSVRGRVLEIKDSGYTKRFGTGVERSDVLDIDASNGHATIVADLASADAIPAECFDCFILVHTLQYIYNPRSALDRTMPFAS